MESSPILRLGSDDVQQDTERKKAIGKSTIKPNENWPRNGCKSTNTPVIPFEANGEEEKTRHGNRKMNGSIMIRGHGPHKNVEI